MQAKGTLPDRIATFYSPKPLSDSIWTVCVFISHPHGCAALLVVSRQFVVPVRLVGRVSVLSVRSPSARPAPLAVLFFLSSHRRQVVVLIETRRARSTTQRDCGRLWDPETLPRIAAPTDLFASPVAQRAPPAQPPQEYQGLRVAGGSSAGRAACCAHPTGPWAEREPDRHPTPLHPLSFCDTNPLEEDGFVSSSSRSTLASTSRFSRPGKPSANLPANHLSHKFVPSIIVQRPALTF
ncbi:hypothetical protein B0H67DRAFT_36347 [Lasiosphaeris hirsuta]|uniref:Uncharacterized protein n=1 Tax=Lasiosphaeris hirsuta TaxID=260670 RepID=A0AA40BAA6_9PEZI|nr:hypothetical protein B0H67DRAFT_36347 [Lasiosphaeris hirsuta]